MNESSTAAAAAAAERLEPCGVGEDTCNTIGWEASIIVLSVFSVIVNSFHLFILTRLQITKGSAYLRILQNICIADLLCGITFSIKMSCPIRKIALEDRRVAAAISLLDVPLFMKYFTLATAVIERLIVLRQPDRYRSNFYIKYIVVWLTLQWLFAITIAALRDSLFYKDICMGMSIGPTNVTTRFTTIIAMGVSLLPSLVIAISIILIGVELHKLKRRTISEHQKSLVAATRFIVIIAVVFLLCLVPLIVSLLVERISGGDSVAGDDAASSAWLAQTLYSIINTFVYGIMTKAYRQEIISVSKRILVSTEIESQASTTRNSKPKDDISSSL